MTTLPPFVRNYVVSLVRTGVMLGVGVLLTFVAAHSHIVISEHTRAAVAALAMSILAAAYYGVVRLLEHWQPKLGVLLGIPAPPNYSALADAGHAAAHSVLADLDLGPAVDPLTEDGKGIDAPDLVDDADATTALASGTP